MKETSGSSAYVPKEPEKDVQLQYALSFLRGTATDGKTAGATIPAPTTTPPAAVMTTRKRRRTKASPAPGSLDSCAAIDGRRFGAHLRFRQPYAPARNPAMSNRPPPPATVLASASP